MKHYAAAYAGRKAGEAVAIVRERTEEKLGAGTVWRIILLVLVVGSLFLPSNFLNGMAGYTLPFVVLVTLWLSGNIAVRQKHKAIPQFRRTLSHSHGWMLVFGLSLVVVGAKALLPSAYFLWVIVSAVFAVMAVIIGARAALAGVAETKAEVAREESLVLLLAICLSVNERKLLERWNDGDVDMEDTYDGGILVELPEEFYGALDDEAKVVERFAKYAPAYEISEDDIEPSRGTLVLHPVTAETHARRENLRASGNLTSETFDIDEGDVRRGRADFSDFSLDD